MKKQSLIVLAIIAVVLVLAGAAYYRQHQKAQDIVDETSVRTVVTQFGTTIQKVSLSAPDALDEIAAAYSPYASAALINEWKANKSFAPGRGVSSPWPDRIEINSVTKGPDGTYAVQGTVIEVTSKEITHGGIAAQFPVMMVLKKINNQWLMAAYLPGPIQELVNASSTIQ